MWGQPVRSTIRGGGNGIPAAELVARARPDGLTIFATSAMTQAVNPAIYDKLPYDPVDSFEAITRMGTSPFVLLVDANSPIRTAAELTATLKANPATNNFGAGALPARVASELYKMEAGVEAVYVGYKGNPQAIPDLQSGLLSFMMIDTVNAKIAIDRGALRRACSSPTPNAIRRCPTCRPRPKRDIPVCCSRRGPATTCRRARRARSCRRSTTTSAAVAAMPEVQGAARRVGLVAQAHESRGVRRLHRFREGALGQDHPIVPISSWNRREPWKDRCAATTVPVPARGRRDAPYDTITVDK